MTDLAELVQASEQMLDAYEIWDVSPPVVVCMCPPVWHGIIAPYCHVHNPGAGGVLPTVTTSTLTAGWSKA